MKDDIEGHLTRSFFALDLQAKKPLIRQTDELFKKQQDNPGGRDISEAAARALTGFTVLIDAINRAKSTIRGDPQGPRGDHHRRRSADHAVDGRAFRREGAEHRHPRHHAADPAGRLRDHLAFRPRRGQGDVSSARLQGEE